MNMKNRLGLHLRIQSSIIQLLEKAGELELPFFQCFFVRQETGKMVGVSAKEISFFLKVRRERYKDLFCHGSYWINLASLGNNGYSCLQREITLAKRLEFTHFLLHPGTAKGAFDKNQGIDALVRCLNEIISKEHNITILLENTCHGKLAVGSDILDFKIILEKIDQPERIGFCIDTAHAYSFGYNVADDKEQDEFIVFLENTIGLERIKLIHLNDAADKLGSQMDRHKSMGEGRIGFNALSRFALHPQLYKIPLLLELPDISIDEEKRVLERVLALKK
jgi:deoxyribonuclease-4